MHSTSQDLRRDALDIWQAGVDAVRGDQLVRDNVRVEGKWLQIADETIDLELVRHIVVVGAGKAGAGMAAGLEEALGAELLAAKQVTGWVNVPADCLRELGRIHLHAARPAGVNEPTAAGVEGTRQILKLAASLSNDDLCICLISGGGSALMPAPAPGIKLSDKQAVTTCLSAAGANIEQLNIVRKQLSAVKGGGLARACGAARLVSLVISDVLGDPLDLIASGPTADDTSTPQAALKVLQQVAGKDNAISGSIFEFLRNKQDKCATSPMEKIEASVANVILGNNAVAVDAAGLRAEQLGYRHAMVAANKLEGEAEVVGRHHAKLALEMQRGDGPNCLVTGGEPVVQLIAKGQRGRGGRSQQLVLAALDELVEHLQVEFTSTAELSQAAGDLVILSGGTDGEDGPTDAAGAVLDGEIILQTIERGLDTGDFLRRNDAYHFFDPLNALIRSGPTHTNVCDLRVVLVRQASNRPG